MRRKIALLGLILFALCTAVFLLKPPSTKNRTLVIILGETRAHELTYKNIKKNLIDTVDGDLAVCIGVNDKYDTSNPFYKNAKYKFTYQEPEDYGSAFDYAYEILLKENPPAPKDHIHWREFLKIKDQFLGGIKDPENQHPGSAGILIFYRWFLLKNLIDQDLLDKYDFFIITRSDYIYKLPHPKMDILSKDAIYIPNGELYSGVTDRHVILPKKFVVAYLNILNNMVSQGAKYYEEMVVCQPLNLEQLIKLHLTQNNVFQFVKLFPYVMYTVRPVGGSTRWSSGVYSKEHGYFIKYPEEHHTAQIHQRAFKKGRCSLDDFYKQRIVPYPS